MRWAIGLLVGGGGGARDRTRSHAVIGRRQDDRASVPPIPFQGCLTVVHDGNHRLIIPCGVCMPYHCQIAVVDPVQNHRVAPDRYGLALKVNSRVSLFAFSRLSGIGFTNPETDRSFHLSVANNLGGDLMKSIGSICPLFDL